MTGVALALALLAAGEGSGPPRLSAPELRVELGEVRSGPVVESRIVLLNDSRSEAVRVVETRPGCGCLKPRLSTEVVPPGGSVDVVMRLNTLTQPAGRQTWTLTLRHRPERDPAARVSECVIRVTARLRREVAVEPAALALRTSGEATHTLTLIDERPRPLGVRAVRCSAPWLRAEVGPTSVEGSRRTTPIRITLARECLPGRYDETLYVDTDDPAYSPLEVPVRVDRTADDGVQVVPEELLVRLRDARTPATGLLQVRCEAGAVEIERVECDRPGVDSRWASGPNGAAVRVKVDPAAAGPEGAATLRLHLRSPAAVRTVPVRWQVP
jgi:hypothetical protein